MAGGKMIGAADLQKGLILWGRHRLYDDTVNMAKPKPPECNPAIANLSCFHAAL
ncbi:MAG: hypothetical protein JW795_02035 [Chitinivibrionales bacterium]|nr:hypothetical protein [Chitinivibrionales bacterium]